MKEIVLNIIDLDKVDILPNQINKISNTYNKFIGDNLKYNTGEYDINSEDINNINSE